MTDIKLFRTNDDAVQELPGRSVALERSLQSLIETNLDAFFGIRFLESEYPTGKTHGGRIDTLGLDENNVPVIIEYKRSINENVISQGLYYLDWLLDHQAEFDMLAMRKFGREISDHIEWSGARLLCIAGDFTKFDEHAVQQIDRSIELVRYVRYGEEFILFELVNATTQTPAKTTDTRSKPTRNTQTAQRYATVKELLDKADSDLQDLFDELRTFLISLGDDVTEKWLLYYVAFKRIRNFVCVEVHPQTAKLSVFVKVDPDTVDLEENFTRDVRDIGHLGTGDLEISLRTREDFERAKPLLLRSYEGS